MQESLPKKEQLKRAAILPITPATILTDILWAVDQPLEEALIARAGESAADSEHTRQAAQTSQRVALLRACRLVHSVKMF